MVTRSRKSAVSRKHTGQGLSKGIFHSGVTADHQNVRLTVNGNEHEFLIGKDVMPWHTLAETLREKLNLTGTKIGCDEGACGACTVLVDGKPMLSCLMLTVECDGREITTVEGLGRPLEGKLDPVQQAFVENTAFQCGFCTPGIIMSVKALLEKYPTPDESQIEEALGGHYCRCISHYHVIEAVKSVIASKKASENV